MTNLKQKQAIVEALNSLEVIESNGGESFYILVENSEYNHKILNEAGLSSDIINKYVEDNSFCIVYLGFSEDLVDLFTYDKAVVLEDKVEIVVGNNIVTLGKSNDKYELFISKEDSVVSMVLSNKQLEDVKALLG